MPFQIHRHLFVGRTINQSMTATTALARPVDEEDEVVRDLGVFGAPPAGGVARSQALRRHGSWKLPEPPRMVRLPDPPSEAPLVSAAASSYDRRDAIIR